MKGMGVEMIILKKSKIIKRITSVLTVVAILLTMASATLAEQQKEPVNNEGDAKILSERKSIDKDIFERTYIKQDKVHENKLGVSSRSKLIKKSQALNESDNVEKALTTIYSEGFDAYYVDDITMSYYTVDNSYGSPYPVWYYSPSSYMVHPYAYPHSGTRVARFNSYDTPRGNVAALETDNLIYPINSSDINITFYMYNDTAYSSLDDFVIPYIISPGEDPIYADPIYRYEPGLSLGWYIVDLTLTGGITGGEGFYLGFLGVGDYGNDIYIDTIKLTQESYIPVSSITLSKNSITLKQGSSDTLNATVLPFTATNKSVSWQTSSSIIATVNSAGVVTAVNTGTATITARSVDNPVIYDICIVTVEPLVTVILGDINGDGLVTSADATEALLHYAGLKTHTGDKFTAGDVNKDGFVTSADAAQILMKYAGISVGW